MLSHPSMLDPSPALFRRTFVTLFASALAAGAITALVDLTISSDLAADLISARTLFSALFATVGLYSLFGALIGGAEGLLFGSMASVFPVRDTVGRLLGEVRADATKDRRWAGGLLAAGLALLGLSLLLFL